MTKKIFEDIFNHDFSLLFAQITNDSETIEKIPWSKEVFTFHPYCVHARIDGMLHFLYDKEGMEWKINQAGIFDKKICVNKMRSSYDVIKDVIEEEKTLSKDELISFWTQLRSFWTWYDCFYWMVEYYDRNNLPMEDLLAVRKETEKLGPGFQASMRNTLCALYPDKKEFVDVMSYEEAISGEIPSVDILRKRLSEFAYFNKKVYLDLNKLLENISIVIKNDIPSELKGRVAFAGKVTGKVKKLRVREDNAKVEEGDIIVASSTTPDFLPAMKKSAAIISEHGGLISHAAITSRELKKPCLIGVKGAMNMLRDGDLVEVDAIKGVVKKC